MDSPARQAEPAEQRPILAATNLRAERLFGDRSPVLGHLVPKGRRPGVSSYRVFMTVVFACIVLVDEWSDRSLSAVASSDVVGPASVIVWAMTLLGSFGVGPVAAIWNAMRR
jgi:hypothetical protein